jgi:glycosyltransferase involved in cell wall biosynthesis
VNILFISNGYPPHSTAGAENYTAGIAAALAAAGHQVAVVCSGDWDRGPAPFNGIRREVIAGVTVVRLDLNWARGPNPNGYLFDNPLTETQVSSLLEQVRPEVVHITSCYTLSASVIRAVRSHGCPLVVTLTDFWFFCPQVTLLRSDGQLCDGQTTAWDCLRCLLGNTRAFRLPARWLPEPIVAAGLTWLSQTPALSRRTGLRGMALDMGARKRLLPALLNQAELVIAPSQFLAEIATACGLARPARVMAYGHSLDWVEQLPARTAHSELRVGYVGRLTPVKGVHVLLKALLQLPLNNQIQAHVFGDLEQEPAYAAELLGLAAGRPEIQFHGRFGRDQLADVYGQLDVLVVPSLWYENNPLVIQEAFAAGLPVVASRLGGMAEFVTPGVNGLLFEPGDPASLAAALAELMAQPDRLPRLRAGMPAVRTIRKEIEALSEIYATLASGIRPGADKLPHAAPTAPAGQT